VFLTERFAINTGNVDKVQENKLLFDQDKDITIKINFMTFFDYYTTECVTDLDLQSEIIIFESIFSTIESNSFYWGSSGISENWLKPKTEPP